MLNTTGYILLVTCLFQLDWRYNLRKCDLYPWVTNAINVWNVVNTTYLKVSLAFITQRQPCLSNSETSTVPLLAPLDILIGSKQTKCIHSWYWYRKCFLINNILCTARPNETISSSVKNEMQCSILASFSIFTRKGSPSLSTQNSISLFLAWRKIHHNLPHREFLAVPIKKRSDIVVLINSVTMIIEFGA